MIKQVAAHLNSSKRTMWERKSSALFSHTPSVTYCLQSRRTKRTLNIGISIPESWVRWEMWGKEFSRGNSQVSQEMNQFRQSLKPALVLKIIGKLEVFKLQIFWSLESILSQSWEQSDTNLFIYFFYSLTNNSRVKRVVLFFSEFKRIIFLVLNCMDFFFFPIFSLGSRFHRYHLAAFLRYKHVFFSITLQILLQINGNIIDETQTFFEHAYF